MDAQAILALFDRELRAEIAYPGMEKSASSTVVRFTRAKPEMSFVLYSDLTEDNADRAIGEQLDYVRQHDLRFEWKVYGHDRPSDLGRRLAAQGFVGEEPDAIMVLELDQVPATLLHPVTADIRLVSDPKGLVDVVTVLESVWGGDFDWVHQRLGDHLTIPGYLSVYVGYVDERPAAVGWTYFYEGHFAGLWAGSTIEEMRDRGLYKSLLAARLQEALARGKQFVTLDAGPMSKPIVARYGFRELTTAAAYEWSGEAVDDQPPG